MGFISNLLASSRKSSRLQELQKLIATSSGGTQDLISEALAAAHGKPSGRDRALEEYLDFCEADPGVRQVMGIEGLTRDDLKAIYVSLVAAGLGCWIKGHYAALSTIAYVEPLQFAARAPKMGLSKVDVLGCLQSYWENDIPQGGLLTMLRQR